jgi:hypothetical protein
MLTIVGILAGTIILAVVINAVIGRLPRRNRLSDVDRFHCQSGIPGEFRDKIGK